MANPIVHFEIPADDVARARAFYENTFGWKIKAFPMPPGSDEAAIRDASPITQIEAAIDGGDWLPVAPADGIADELTEAFAVRLPKLPRGPHAVVVRATDGADNVGAAHIVIEVP